ncbi:amidohydrolase [Cellulomonas sp. Marseille-Q8402]
MSTTLYRGGALVTPAVLATATSGVPEPGPTALLVVDGVIAWLGGEDEADGLADGADDVVRLDGALVTPGFVDAHAHVLDTALRLDGLDLSSCPSLEDALTAVRAAVDGPAGRRLAVEGGPLAGWGWDEHAWRGDPAPTRADLDAAAGGAPVYLGRVDLHSAVVSTSFAEVVGLVGLPGWRADGRVTGEAHAAARAAVRDVGDARRGELDRSALTAAARAGVVALHEQSAPQNDTRAGLAGLLARTADPASALPLVVGYRAELCETADDAREVAAALPGLAGVGGDLAVDGSLGSRTAALRAPYVDLPTGSTGLAGHLALTAEQVSNHVAAVTRAGLQAAFHVIGDRALDEALLGFRVAAEVEGVDAVRSSRHRIEHASMLDAPALASLVLLGITASVQPAFDAAWGGDAGMYAARLGRGRAASLHPLADLRAAGVPLAFGSDSPGTPFDPWGAGRAAGRHRTRDQRLPVAAAVDAHTRGGWAAAGDGTAGSLAVGAPAHLAVWRVAEPGPGGLPALREDDPAPECLRTGPVRGRAPRRPRLTGSAFRRRGAESSRGRVNRLVRPVRAFTRAVAAPPPRSPDRHAGRHAEPMSPSGLFGQAPPRCATCADARGRRPGALDTPGRFDRFCEVVRRRRRAAEPLGADRRGPPRAPTWPACSVENGHRLGGVVRYEGHAGRSVGSDPVGQGRGRRAGTDRTGRCRTLARCRPVTPPAGGARSWRCSAGS